MRRLLFLAIVFFVGLEPLCLFAAEKQDSSAAKERIFVVETDRESASESMERISGKIDLGFSSPSNSFESSDHYKPGPFGRAEAAQEKTS